MLQWGLTICCYETCTQYMVRRDSLCNTLWPSWSDPIVNHHGIGQDGQRVLQECWRSAQRWLISTSHSMESNLSGNGGFELRDVVKPLDFFYRHLALLACKFPKLPRPCAVLRCSESSSYQMYFSISLQDKVRKQPSLSLEIPSLSEIFLIMIIPFWSF